jgi:F0F1-type ATP synthase epsilon subunit
MKPQKIQVFDAIDVVVRKREGLVFTGHVFAISSTNKIGDFDVLPGHANFICTIYDHLTIHNTRERSQDIKIDSGILRAKGNLVEVYLGI